MTITLNGEARELDEGATLADLVALLGLTQVKHAVELNRDVVPKAEHAARQLSDGDAVEIVTFVGGG